MGDALHTHGGVTDAREARIAQAGLIAVQGPTALDARTGVLFGPGSTALVTGTSSTAPMRVAIGAHQWVTTRGSANGPYLGALEATQLVDIAAAPASGTRIDIIYVKQGDATAGVPTPDGATAPVYGALTGVTGSGKPNLATVVGAEELATVSVTAGATATNGANILITNTSRPTVSRGARIPVRSSTDRDAITKYPGLEVYRLDTGAVEILNLANEWVTLADLGAWGTYTPTWTAASSPPSVGNGSLVGRTRKVGRTVHVDIHLVFGSTTGGGAGAMSFALPFPATALARQTAQAYCLTSDGVEYGATFNIDPGATTIIPKLPAASSVSRIAAVANASAGGAPGTGNPTVSGAYSFLENSRLTISGTYEAAA